MEKAMDVLYPRCAGLDVHKDTVVAAVRIAANGPANTEVRTFDTTTPGLLALSGWLAECGCTHVAMEATGVYWKPVWHIASAKRPHGREPSLAGSCRAPDYRADQPQRHLQDGLGQAN
jgi:hypothetical protein